ncbi:LAFA_0D14994g1_1 [Lachancea sp. 'fantastica']|nr:LAFA_0D14994g1_1 [Lachancea sp. 'fantastica']
MVHSPSTPTAGDGKAQYEFTPIGQAKSVSKPGSPSDDPKKRASQIEESLLSPEREEDGPRKRARTSDDTLNSTRIFNESSFDDTLPSHAGIPSLRRNRANEIIGQANGDNENVGASNPLKEQQDTMYKLNVENYNLRVKCNSLLKFLNNVTDEGELKENLAIMDELQDWKSKYQKLAASYRELQLKFDESGDLESRRRETTLQNEQLADLEEKLREYQESVSKSKEHITKLENKLKISTNGSNARGGELEVKVRELREQIHHLEAQIAEKTKQVKDREGEIDKLNSTLKRQDAAYQTLQKKTEQQLQKIEDLELKVQNTEQQVQKLKRALETARSELQTTTLGTETRDASTQLRIDSLQDTNSRLQRELDQALSEFHQSQAQIEKLNSRAKDMAVNIKMKDDQIHTLQHEIKQTRHRASHRKDDVQENSLLNEKVKALTAELQRIIKEKESLEKDNDSLRERIVTQATRSPALKENRRTQERALDISKLQLRVEELQNELNLSQKSAVAARQNHSMEVERLQAQIENSDMQPFMAKRKLEKEVSILKMELESLRETKDREISLLENRCEMLKKENAHLLQQAASQADLSQRQIAEKQKEIDELIQRCSGLSTERLKLKKDLSQAQESEAQKIGEMSKQASRLEYVTNEFVKYKELTGSSSDPNAATLNERWSEKYRNMKRKILQELKALQSENLDLERRLLEGRKPVPRSASPDLNKLSLKDQLDYYKLRYRHETVHNSDLRVMNEYLNRVLRASSRHLRLDIMKLEDEALSDLSPDYTSHHRRRLKFKTVALMVLAAVRFEHAAQRVRWDAQRLHYLRQKIVLDQDRVTW